MTKAIANYILEINYLEKKLVGFLALALFLMILSYIYLINYSIFQVALRRETEEKIATVETQITGLVSDYMALSGELTLEKAIAMGFYEVENDSRFVSRKAPASVALSLGR